MRLKCVVLLPGNICRWSKNSIAFRVFGSEVDRAGDIDEVDEDADAAAEEDEDGAEDWERVEGVADIRSKLSISLASSGASVLDAAPILIPWCFNCCPISPHVLATAVCETRYLYGSKYIRHVVVEPQTLSIAILHFCAIGDGFERRPDVRVYPERPESVVKIEDYEFWEGLTVGED